MKAIILAAGKGTRMGSLTEETPKPMLRVEGKPILEHILGGLRQAGIVDICLITGWKAEVIEQHLGDGSALGVNLQYRQQTLQDGTGRAALPARDFVGKDDFLLTYGDILVRPETYHQMVQRFSTAAFDGLLTVTEGEDVTQGGSISSTTPSVLPSWSKNLLWNSWKPSEGKAFSNRGTRFITMRAFTFSRLRLLTACRR